MTGVRQNYSAVYARKKPRMLLSFPALIYFVSCVLKVWLQETVYVHYVETQFQWTILKTQVSLIVVLYVLN